MNRSRSRILCQVCESSDYVLRDGNYFCVHCATQSQELGHETMMEDDTVPGGLTGQGCDRISVRSKRSVWGIPCLHLISMGYG